MMPTGRRAKASREAARCRLVYSIQTRFGERHHGNARKQLDERSTRSEAARVLPPLGSHLRRRARCRGAVWDLRSGSRADGIRGWIAALYYIPGEPLICRTAANDEE